MELKEMIEMGAVTVGNQSMLAREIGLHPNQLTDAKAGRNGIPGYACIKLASLISIDPICVIAASELVTEKHKERIALWQRLSERDWRRGWDSNPR